MQRRRLLQLVALSSTLGSTLGSASRLARAATADLVVAVNQTTIESAPFFTQAIPGIRVVPVPNGRAASAQLVSGMVDAATGSETQVLLNSSAQPDLRIVLTVAECRYRMVARRSAGVSNIADLRGKRIAHTPGTSSQFFLVDMLRTAQLTVKDVTLVTLEGPDMPKALSEKQIDAMAMWEPHSQLAIDQLGNDAVELTHANAYFERFNLNTTASVLADPAKRVLLLNAMTAIRQESQRLSQSPKPLWPALAAAINTSEDIIGKVWPQFRFPATLDAEPLLALLTRMEPWAAEVGKRPPRDQATLAQLIDTSLLTSL
jgi:sulfonate transport system substrate-binding protein